MIVNCLVFLLTFLNSKLVKHLKTNSYLTRVIEYLKKIFWCVSLLKDSAGYFKYPAGCHGTLLLMLFVVI